MTTAKDVLSLDSTRIELLVRVPVVTQCYQDTPIFVKFCRVGHSIDTRVLLLGCFSCNKKTELCIIVVKKGISRQLLNIVP